MSEKYCVVDLETTGGRGVAQKIIEIGVVLVDGDKIVKTYQSLINPERSIPWTITRLTGIREGMLVDAPKFYEVAKDIVELCKGRIFVAHNVHFDFYFMHKEFKELGYAFNPPKICTVQAMRKSYPGLPSYSLGNLCKHFSIPLENAHRALDDARACAELLRLSSNEFCHIQKTPLPPNLNVEDLNALPEAAGVYLLKNSQDEILYIGKSKNLKKRVQTHMRVIVDKKGDLEFKNAIARLEYQETGSELLALVYEDTLIKKYRPRFNRKAKRSRRPYGLFINDEGLVVRQVHNGQKPYLWVKSKRSGEQFIQTIYLRLFGTDQSLSVWREKLGEIFFIKIQKELSRFQYPLDDCDLEIAGARYVIRDGELNRAHWGHKEFILQESYEVRQLICRAFSEQTGHSINVAGDCGTSYLAVGGTISCTPGGGDNPACYGP